MVPRGTLTNESRPYLCLCSLGSGVLEALPAASAMSLVSVGSVWSSWKSATDFSGSSLSSASFGATLFALLGCDPCILWPSRRLTLGHLSKRFMQWLSDVVRCSSFLVFIAVAICTWGTHFEERQARLLLRTLLLRLVSLIFLVRSFQFAISASEQ